MRASLSHFFTQFCVPEQEQWGEAGKHGLVQYTHRKEGRWIPYLNQGGQRQPIPPQLRIWQGFWRKSRGFVPHPALGPSVCLTDCLAASASLLLTLPPSQRILFSTTQMFRTVCCATLSCVYNKEVLVWRSREGREVGEWVPLEEEWRSLHCWCKHWMMPALPLASN